MASEWIRIGQIVGEFGLKGLVKVTPLTDFWDRFEKGSRVRINDEWMTIESVSEHKGHILLKLSDVPNISAAEKLKWAYLEAPGSERPELEDDEYMTAELIGLQVVTDSGEKLGVVDNVLHAPAHDILVIGKLMIPTVKHFVRKVDLDKRTITVALIPGMLDEVD